MFALDPVSGTRRSTIKWHIPALLAISDWSAPFDSNYARIATIGQKVEGSSGSLSAGYYDQGGAYTQVTASQDGYGTRTRYDGAIFLRDQLVAHTTDGWLVDAGSGARISGQMKPQYIGSGDVLVATRDNKAAILSRYQVSGCAWDTVDLAALVCSDGGGAIRVGERQFGKVDRIGHVADVYKDGSALYVGKDGILYLIRRSGGETTALTPSTDFEITSATLSPDGTKIAYSARRDRATVIWVVSASGGTPWRLAGNQLAANATIQSWR